MSGETDKQMLDRLADALAEDIVNVNTPADLLPADDAEDYGNPQALVEVPDGAVSRPGRSPSHDCSKHSAPGFASIASYSVEWWRAAWEVISAALETTFSHHAW